MLFGLGSRALMNVTVAVAVAAGGAGGFAVAASEAAGFPAPASGARNSVVKVQSSPQPAPCGTSDTSPCKGTKARPKLKHREKQRHMTPCGPGLAPCPDAK
jgi:hypothetical protein